MNSVKIPVIYILSNGHSGSTLLDLLLGLHPNIWTLGEAQLLPWELLESRNPCGCGAILEECKFWRPILVDIPLKMQDISISHFREAHNAGRVIRWNHILGIDRYGSPVKWRQSVDIYGKLNYRYFEVVRAAAESHAGAPIRWLIDASKDVYRLNWLTLSERFDIRVIHLVKDPRSFVYSMCKSDLESLQRAIRFGGRWLLENTHFSYLGFRSMYCDRLLRIRYEDLATSPTKVLQRIGSWIKEDFNDVDLEGFRGQTNHAISGNATRWMNSSIKLDERWRSELPARQARLVWSLTRFLARWYGYE